MGCLKIHITIKDKKAKPCVSPTVPRLLTMPVRSIVRFRVSEVCEVSGVPLLVLCSSDGILYTSEGDYISLVR